MRVVIALGRQRHDLTRRRRAAPRTSTAAVARRAADRRPGRAGHEVLLTHGNGPQVGNILLKNELAAAVVPPVPLSWCGAQTQATIGMLLMNSLDAALASAGLDKRIATLVSRTLVDPDDPAFEKPHQADRPLPHRSEDAEAMMDHGERYVEIPGERGWRRVVASPSRSSASTRPPPTCCSRRGTSSSAPAAAASRPSATRRRLRRHRGRHRQGPHRGAAGRAHRGGRPRHRHRRRERRRRLGHPRRADRSRRSTPTALRSSRPSSSSPPARWAPRSRR